MGRKSCLVLIFIKRYVRDLNKEELAAIKYMAKV
jgi:hypothetical protein